MDSLTKNIYSAISAAIAEFASRIEKEHDVSKDSILELWNSIAPEDIKSSKKEVKKTVTKKSSKKSEDDDAPQCSYIVKSSGKQCTKKRCGESEEFCNAHMKQFERAAEKAKEKENNPKKETKAKKENVKDKKASAAKKDAETISKLKSDSNNNQPISLRKNKFGNFEYSSTGFVFDCGTKKVVGTQSSTGEIIELTAANIEECKRLRFKYVQPETIKGEEDEVLEEGEELEEEDESEEEEEDVDDE